LRDWIVNHPLTALLAAALLIKAILLFVAIPALSDIVAPRYGIGFADNYDLLARNLLLGNGYRFQEDTALTLMREPGYPLFLAGVFKVLGDSLVSARIANLFLSLGVAIMLAQLANRITGDKLAAGLAALVYLFYPGTIIAEARGGVEIFFMFALLLFMLGLHAAMERGRVRDFALAGLLLGAVVLIRSTPLLFPIVVFAILMVTASSMKERLQQSGNVVVMILTMILVMTPWIVRNYQLVNEIVPTSSVQGVAAQTGQYICEHLSFDNGFEVLDQRAARERNALASDHGYEYVSKYYQYFYTPEDELRFNGMLMRQVVDKYRDDPLLYARCVTTNAFNFWFSGKSWTVTWLNVLVQLPLLVLAAAGAVSMWRQGRIRQIAVIGMFILYVYGLHAAIHAQVRYSIPLIPFLAILASITVSSMFRLRQNKETSLDE
jgi:4-amino-4-deoxy-L-arabinose transferase-like glycosyltransferase